MKPPYIKPAQQQAVHYVEELLSLTKKEVILYNNSSRTGFDLDDESLQHLVAKHPQIVGLKEGGDIRRHVSTKFPLNFVLYAAGDMQAEKQIKDRMIKEFANQPLIKAIKDHYNRLGIEAGVCRSPL